MIGLCLSYEYNDKKLDKLIQQLEIKQILKERVNYVRLKLERSNTSLLNKLKCFFKDGMKDSLVKLKQKKNWQGNA